MVVLEGIIEGPEVTIGCPVGPLVAVFSSWLLLLVTLSGTVVGVAIRELEVPDDAPLEL